MAAFSVTPEALLDQARNLFVSEAFGDAFELIQSSSPDLDQDTILKLLKGELKIVTTDLEQGQVDIVDEDDEEYPSLCQEILENYDYLVTINEMLYQVKSSAQFDLSLIASENALVNDFKANEGEPLNTSKYRFSEDLQRVSGQIGMIMEAPKVIYLNGSFYAIDRYEGARYEEICTEYDSPKQAVEAYAKAQG